MNAVVSKPEFEAAYAEMNRRLPASVQALALTWMLPYRAGCMSITAAFALGYDEATCVEGCKPTPVSRYFDSDTREPYTDLRVRAAQYPLAARQARASVAVQPVAGDLLYDKHDVLFYFTGLTYVVGLRTNTYLPGAIADHLTSAGGVLDGTRGAAGGALAVISAGR